MFEAPEAADLIGCFVQAVSGGSLYRKSSFLLDSLGQQVFAPHVHIARGAAPAARARQRAVRQRRCRDGRRATSCSDGVRARLFPRQLFGAQARHEHRPATPAAATTSSSRTGTDDLAALHRAHGTRPARHRAAGAGREPRDRRLLARRRGLLGRGRRDRLSGRGDHHRRQPAATCSATSSRSAATSTGAARATSARYSIDRMTVAGQ